MADTLTIAPAYRHHKGLTVDIYIRAGSQYDASAGGASNAVDQLTIVGIIDKDHDRIFHPLPEGSRVFAPRMTAPPAVIIRRGSLTPIIVPVFYVDEQSRLLTMEDASLDPAEPEAGIPHGVVLDGNMAGGTLAASSDSRLSQAAGKYLPAYDIHDRDENRDMSYGQRMLRRRLGSTDPVTAIIY